jgi:hypothetical protein
MMGTAAVGAVSMGFVRRNDCGPGQIGESDAGLREYCGVSYGGFGGAPHRLHAHFHGGPAHGGHAHGGG